MIPRNTVIDECESTNDLARRLGEEGCPHGTWISALRQTRGRGRMGREWKSLDGNLFLSMVVRLERPERWTWIPLASAVAIARAFPGLGLKIKWPNDLVLNDRKLAGILCEGVSGAKGSFVVMGLGLNVEQAPEGTEIPAIALKEAAQSIPTLDALRFEIVRELLSVYSDLSKSGPAQVAAEFFERAYYPRGSRVTWGKGQSGSVAGLGAAGELQVKLDDGHTESLFAEEISLRGQL